MNEFANTLYTNYINFTKMIIFDFLKTGNPIYDSMLSTIVISFISFILTYSYNNTIDILLFNCNIDDIKPFFYKQNSIIIEGNRSAIANNYTFNICSNYSDRFKAIWNYIISNIHKNTDIFCIKETHSNYQSCLMFDEKRKNLDLFIVFQKKHFKIDENIQVKVILENEESRDDHGKLNSKTDKISIILYSYTYSINYLIEYIDNITKEYLSSIKQNRLNTKFIYLLEKVKVNDEENQIACWREDVFESARTFNNIFFDGKRELISKIDFFIHNKTWYYDKGIPYSLGIGLHGPPGTGKTSVIKALANYTNRHIIVLSLKLIKTKRQLENFFLENTYNNDNEKNSIGFDKKIIVFEDIDCIGDIVLDREQQQSKPTRTKKNKIFDPNAESIKIADVLQSINDTNDDSTIKLNLNDDPPITLDDILNLWDGIRETPGRILIISSNYYSKLDPALIRPGRIDITHELSNASHNVIAEIYMHLFNNSINKNILSKIKPNFYSPAELINMYVSHKNEKDFLCRLLQNKK